MYMCDIKVQMTQRSEESVGSPGAGVVGSCESSKLAARNRTPVFCKSSKFS